MQAPIRIAIAAGGTAGHVVPALVVADELRARGASIVFIGGERAERELVPAAGYELRQLTIAGIDRTRPLKAAGALMREVAATAAARKLLRREGVDGVLGGGGYAAAPVAAAALSLRLPVVLTEADGELGLANRILAPFARRVCLAFPVAGRSGGRYLVTGRPVAPLREDRDGARERLGIGPEERVVVVFGGSLGARSINQAALAAFDGAGFRVIHISGERDYAELAARLGVRANYELHAYLPLERFATVLAAADLAVARAGGSIFELAANSVPAVLIPYPHAAGEHQLRNAAWMQRAGAAIVIPDPELTAARLASEVGSLLADPSRLAVMTRASQSLARPDASRRVAEEVLSSLRH